MVTKTYLILLADKKRAKFILLSGGMVEKEEEYIKSDVPQKVKHGDDTWDAQDKIFRHIQVHLHKHLVGVGKRAEEFVKGSTIHGILIGGHKTLFAEIQKYLPPNLNRKVKGTFVAELKVPLNQIIQRAERKIGDIETG